MADIVTFAIEMVGLLRLLYVLFLLNVCLAHSFTIIMYFRLKKSIIKNKNKTFKMVTISSLGLSLLDPFSNHRCSNPVSKYRLIFHQGLPCRDYKPMIFLEDLYRYHVINHFYSEQVVIFELIE